MQNDMQLKRTNRACQLAPGPGPGAHYRSGRRRRVPHIQVQAGHTRCLSRLCVWHYRLWL